MNNTSDSNVRELKIDSTFWATPTKIINLIDLKPEKLSIKTENNKTGSSIKVHQVRHDKKNDDQKNKYHQVWKEIFKIARSAVNNENGELKIHEKIRLFDSDILTDKIIKILSITIVIKLLIEKDNKFYLELALNHCLYVFSTRLCRTKYKIKL